jgi:hypothetical protein
MKKYPYVSALAALTALCLSSAVLSIAHADESVGEKVENKAGDMKTDAKKEHRAAKRHARKAHGTDNVAKDAKDKMNDAGDGVSNEAEKTKRKAD